MGGEKNIINNFGEYSSWLRTLKKVDKKLWTKPIALGKWSVSEIISHIMKWDRHLLSEVIPSVKNGNGITFPEIDTYNKTASDYTKTGVSQIELIEEAIVTRKLLEKELHKTSVEKLNDPTTANGATHCPHTGEPYSLIYIIKEFIEHDYHHKAQVTKFLSESKLMDSKALQ